MGMCVYMPVQGYFIAFALLLKKKRKKKGNAQILQDKREGNAHRPLNCGVLSSLHPQKVSGLRKRLTSFHLSFCSLTALSIQLAVCLFVFFNTAFQCIHSYSLHKAVIAIHSHVRYFIMNTWDALWLRRVFVCVWLYSVMHCYRYEWI